MVMTGEVKLALDDRAKLSDKLDSIRAERSKFEEQVARKTAEFDHQEMVFSTALSYLMESDVSMI